MSFPRSNFFMAIYLIPAVASVVAIVATVTVIFFKARKSDSPKRKILSLVLSAAFVVIACTSFILNMGWLRYIMMFFTIPAIHAVIFFLTNYFAALYTENSKHIRLYNVVYLITYLSFYIFLPDASDYGGFYFFFGLIHNDFLSQIAMLISAVMFCTHIAFFVLLISEIILMRKNKAK